MILIEYLANFDHKITPITNITNLFEYYPIQNIVYIDYPSFRHVIFIEKSYEKFIKNHFWLESHNRISFLPEILE